MSLSRKIAGALDARTESGALPSEVAVEDGPHRLALRLTAAEAVGLAFDSLEFSSSNAPADGFPLEALGAWGARLAARLTYLMEPLVIHESDAVGGQVELRSQTPTLRAGRRTYFEARLDRAGTLRLGRVAFDEATRSRQPIPCQLTREVLERLADDLVATSS